MSNFDLSRTRPEQPSKAGNGGDMKQQRDMKCNEIKGTVVRIEKNKARVVFSNGEARWFALNNEFDREYFALGKQLSVHQYTMPTNRDELFEHLETLPVKIEHLIATWEEGTTKRKGKLMVKAAVGAGLKLANAIEVFGTQNGKYFLVRPNGKNVSRHRYAKPLEVKQAMVRIAEATNVGCSKLIGISCGPRKR